MESVLIDFTFFKKHSFIIRVVAFSLALIALSLAIARTSSGDTLYISAAAGESAPVIIIDAGHGGEDSGAVGRSGVYEKDLNLAISMELGSILSEEGYAVVYTRTDDRLLYGEAGNIVGMKKIYDLKNRCLVSEEYPDSIFVSIHMNSFGESKYSGLQVYYSTKNEGSALLAERIQTSVREGIQPTNNRKTKLGRDLYLMENIESVAVLIECGFISNPEECEKLSEKEYQKQLSFLIACAIIEYDKENSN